MLNREKCEDFVRWVHQEMQEIMDLDSGDVQDKLIDLGLLDRRDVDPSTNEWGADYLYFLKEVG